MKGVPAPEKVKEPML